MKQSSRVIDAQIFDLMETLRAPIITFSQSWADTIPKRLLNAITMARMRALFLGEEMATYEEVLAYMYTRTLESPLHGEWFDIYMHVSCSVCKSCWNEDHWEELQGKKELNDYEKNHLLMPLRKWIYKKRRDAFKPKYKAANLIPVTAEEINVPDIPGIQEYQQLNLF